MVIVLTPRRVGRPLLPFSWRKQFRGARADTCLDVSTLSQRELGGRFGGGVQSLCKARKSLTNLKNELGLLVTRAFVQPGGSSLPPLNHA